MLSAISGPVAVLSTVGGGQYCHLVVSSHGKADITHKPAAGQTINTDKLKKLRTRTK